MIEAIAEAASFLGLGTRGGFHPVVDDGVPPTDGMETGTLVLLGWIGGAQWPAFSCSPEAQDGEPHPLDRWSRRMIDGLASRFGASAFYPFGGPPYLPFQRWAQRADDVSPSPLGIFIHARHGLWHSYRGALGFASRLVLPAGERQSPPCAGCAARPCLTSCPVSAFTPGGYDVEGCARHVKSEAGKACREEGCLARRACPVSPELAYGPEQARFYMDAFVAAH